jgi:threonine aldolase
VFDTISICLSKGLGAPVGSILLGNKNLIEQAKRVRKVFGGTMRQAGFIAAAGLFAIDNNITRLREDHKHAQLIREALSGCSWVKEIMPVDTNIIIFSISDELRSSDIKERLNANGILVIPIDSHRIRMVTHLDISPEVVGTVCDTLKRLI